MVSAPVLLAIPKLEYHSVHLPPLIHLLLMPHVQYPTVTAAMHQHRPVLIVQMLEIDF